MDFEIFEKLIAVTFFSKFFNCFYYLLIVKFFDFNLKTLTGTRLWSRNLHQKLPRTCIFTQIFSAAI
jgi:hypothetical protein